MEPARPVRLAVERLDDRTLPSATVLGLTTHGAEVVADSFIARQVDAQPTGTGNINSFVRVQGAAAGGGTQQGYNTTARPLQFDENKSPQFTRGLTLGQVPRVVVGGVAYREFLLDINQKSSSPLLSLDQVKVFLGGRADLTGYRAGALPGARQVFDLDARGDVSLMLNARLNSGSGSGDMTLLVPEANFAGGGPNAFVYLYSRMGGVAGAAANGGFEEWAVRAGPAAPPATTAGTSSLSGSVFVDIDGNGTRDPGEPGLGGVTIQLQGVDYLGSRVLRTTVTDADGGYTFTGLRAGTYDLWEATQPTRYGDWDLFDGGDHPGYIEGEADERRYGVSGDDRLTSISLGAGLHGKEYNFTEILRPTQT